MFQTVLCVLALLYKVSSLELRPVLTVSPSWLSPGASVTLSCEVKPSSAGWRFYWYKAVPDLSHKSYRYDLLPGGVAGTMKDSYIIHGQKLTAGYSCRAGRGNPEDFTYYSEPKFVWSAVLRPAASLTVSPDMEKHFTDHNVSLNCGGASTEWRVMSYKEIYVWSFLSLCPTYHGPTGPSCIVNSQLNYEAVYWCESGSGEFSNAVNITVHKPKPVLTVSPPWQSPEAPVTLNCQIENLSEGWRIYWYEAVPDVSPGAYRYELLPESISGTIQKSYMVHGQKHTAGYACRAGRGNPEYFTKYSEPKFVWLADPHPAASLSVSPDREQHFTSESVTLNCGGNSTEWRVMEFSATGHLIYLRICLVMTGSLCTINRTHSDKSVYWCESPSGEFSNAVNLTVHDEDLLLVSPVHPVTEGASVTLSCRRRGENKLSDVIFYHNDKLIQNDSRGELKISAVSQSHEGFYKCEHSGEVSPQSWMRVKLLPRPENPSFLVLLVAGLSGLSGKILIILLILLSHCRDLKGP